MDLDPIFQDQPHFPILSSILRGNPTPNPHTPTTMFPTSQGPISPPPLTPPPPPTQPNTNPMLQIGNHSAFAYSLDPASASDFMVTDRNWGQKSRQEWRTGDISQSPDIPIDVNSTVTPCLGISSLLPQDDSPNGSLVRDPINPTTVATVTIAPQNNAYSLHGPYNNNNNTTQMMLDYFPPKTTLMPTNVATMPSSSSFHPPLPTSTSLPPPPPPPILGEHDQIGDGDGVMRRQRRRVKEKNMTYTKGQWSSEEDSILKRLVTEDGTKKWSEITKNLKGRSAKQCRERWFNHLRPDIRKGPWTIEEDMMLMMAHQEVGNKWAEIARRIPGRPENTVKNHWNATKRRRNEKVQVFRVNRPNISDGSMLQAYIKNVTPTTTPQGEEEEYGEELLEEAPNNYNDQMNGEFNNNNNDNDLMDFPNYDFTNEDWVAELFGDVDGGDASVQVNGGNFDF